MNLVLLYEDSDSLLIPKSSAWCLFWKKVPNAHKACIDHYIIRRKSGIHTWVKVGKDTLNWKLNALHSQKNYSHKSDSFWRWCVSRVRPHQQFGSIQPAHTSVNCIRPKHCLCAQSKIYVLQHEVWSAWQWQGTKSPREVIDIFMEVLHITFAVVVDRWLIWHLL
jgi:hypothetical protein